MLSSHYKISTLFFRLEYCKMVPHLSKSQLQLAELLHALAKSSKHKSSRLNIWLAQLQLMRDRHWNHYKPCPPWWTTVQADTYMVHCKNISIYIFINIQLCHLYCILFPPCFFCLKSEQKNNWAACFLSQFLLMFYVTNHIFINFKN